ncbi:MAG TPA: PIG-L family deacetylase [Terriglobales bacterium]|jgi:LmbE family N-acetylglucosaminyl deacetylase|nr:PIG-L family deacetylase [Terriglobales bacterium]
MFRLLCVTAHPDDEAGSFGGTLLIYAERGVQTYVTCLTPGQAARNRGGARSDDELAALRRNEFAAACAILKVHDGEVLGYRDAGLDRENFLEVVGTLVRRIRTVKPHIVLCQGTEGVITAHPDHSMASLFASAAYHWAGRSNRFTDQLESGLAPHYAQKLYYSTAPSSLPDYPHPVALAPITTAIQIGRHLETKIRAFAAHTSQNPLLERYEKTVRARGQVEYYHLANRLKPGHADKELETDLFAGVVE